MTTQKPRAESQSVQLRQWWVEHRLSTREIADRLGVSQATVSRMLQRHGIRRDSTASGIPLFEIPADIDQESRRVIAYVNGEIERVRAGERTEPLGPILEAARDRLERHQRGISRS